MHGTRPPNQACFSIAVANWTPDLAVSAPQSTIDNRKSSNLQLPITNRQCHPPCVSTASFWTVFQLRAVPLAASFLSRSAAAFEFPTPSGNIM